MASTKIRAKAQMDETALLTPEEIAAYNKAATHGKPRAAAKTRQPVKRITGSKAERLLQQTIELLVSAGINRADAEALARKKQGGE